MGRGVTLRPNQENKRFKIVFGEAIRESNPYPLYLSPPSSDLSSAVSSSFLNDRRCSRTLTPENQVSALPLSYSLIKYNLNILLVVIQATESNMKELSWCVKRKWRLYASLHIGEDVVHLYASRPMRTWGYQPLCQRLSSTDSHCR